MRKLLALLVVLGLALQAGGQALAGFYASTERCSYTGTVTKYSTLADAMARTNPVAGPVTMPDRVTDPPYDTPWRDLCIWFLKDIPGSGEGNYFITLWWYGASNPNNTGAGFVQLFDSDATTETSAEGFFDPSLTTFNLHVSGANAGPADSARLWNPEGGLDSGIFHTYTLDAAFGGLSPTWDPSLNLYMSSQHPSSVTGTFNCVFENTKFANTFYVADFELGLDNWAYGQGLIGASDFAGPTPEPATLSLLGLGALALLRRRRRG
jgi:hypothetical protein